MISHITELYGLGAISVSRLFRELIEPPREIIDVEYEDLSDQIGFEPIPPQNELKLLETNKQEKYADSDH